MHTVPAYHPACFTGIPGVVHSTEFYTQLLTALMSHQRCRNKAWPMVARIESLMQDCHQRMVQSTLVLYEAVGVCLVRRGADF